MNSSRSPDSRARWPGVYCSFFEGSSQHESGLPLPLQGQALMIQYKYLGSYYVSMPVDIYTPEIVAPKLAYCQAAASTDNISTQSYSTAFATRAQALPAPESSPFNSEYILTSSNQPSHTFSSTFHHNTSLPPSPPPKTTIATPCTMSSAKGQDSRSGSARATTESPAVSPAEGQPTISASSSMLTPAPTPSPITTPSSGPANKTTIKNTNRYNRYKKKSSSRAAHDSSEITSEITSNPSAEPPQGLTSTSPTTATSSFAAERINAVQARLDNNYYHLWDSITRIKSVEAQLAALQVSNVPTDPTDPSNPHQSFEIKMLFRHLDGLIIHRDNCGTARGKLLCSLERAEKETEQQYLKKALFKRKARARKVEGRKARGERSTDGFVGGGD